MNYSSSRRQKKRWQSVRRINVVDWCACMCDACEWKWDTGDDGVVVDNHDDIDNGTIDWNIVFRVIYTFPVSSSFVCSKWLISLSHRPLSRLKPNPSYESKKVLYFDEPSRVELLDRKNVAKLLRIGLSAAVIPSSFYLVLLGLTSSVTQNKIGRRRRRRRKTSQRERNLPSSASFRRLYSLPLQERRR